MNNTELWLYFGCYTVITGIASMMFDPFTRNIIAMIYFFALCACVLWSHKIAHRNDESFDID